MLCGEWGGSGGEEKKVEKKVKTLEHCPGALEAADSLADPPATEAARPRPTLTRP
eukprot:COSAG01_NODE_438_length_17037_cov_13.150136_6_plen_55_part_00